MTSVQTVLAFLFAFVAVLNAQYLLDPYSVPVYAAAPYSPYYVYGSNRQGTEQPKPSDSSAEKQQMGFIPNPLDPANRQFPPMMPGQNMQQAGPPPFPQPVIPQKNAENMQQQQSAENMQRASTPPPVAAKSKKL